jgi:hypothetical protein
MRNKRFAVGLEARKIYRLEFAIIRISHSGDSSIYSCKAISDGFEPIQFEVTARQGCIVALQSDGPVMNSTIRQLCRFIADTYRAGEEFAEATHAMKTREAADTATR